jgi:hypothetical protein
VNATTAGIFIDLNDDHVDEFVFLTANGGFAYEYRESEWRFIGKVNPEQASTPWSALHTALAQSSVTVSLPKWKELSIGSHTFRVNAK